MTCHDFQFGQVNTSFSKSELVCRFELTDFTENLKIAYYGAQTLMFQLLTMIQSKDNRHLYFESVLKYMQQGACFRMSLLNYSKKSGSPVYDG